MARVSHFLMKESKSQGIPRSHGSEVPQVAGARWNVFGSKADGFVQHVPCMVPVQLAPTLWAHIWLWIAWLHAGTGTKHPHHVHAGSMPSMVKPSSAPMRQTMAGWPFRERGTFRRQGSAHSGTSAAGSDGSPVLRQPPHPSLYMAYMQDCYFASSRQCLKDPLS